MSEKPQQDSAQETGKKKRKGSSFYVYLVILFGAAFLMLLLAYFVQQRSSETAISDLRNSMTLSRDELLEDIQRLEAENEQLRQEAAQLQQKAAELQQAYDEQWGANRQRQAELSNQIISWSLFWSMDSAYRASDYEVCAGFFQNEFTSQTYAAPVEAEERTEEIRLELIQLGYLPEGGPEG